MNSAVIDMAEITAATAPELRELCRLYEREFAEGEKESPAAIRSWLSRQQRGELKPDAYHVIVARARGGRVVGGAFFHYLATINAGFLGYLVVHPAWRRRGIGRRLLRKVESVLRRDARRAKLRDPAGVFMELHKAGNGTSKVAEDTDFWRSLKVFPLDVDWRYPELRSTAAPLDMTLAYHSIHGGRKGPSDPELEEAVRAIYRFVYGHKRTGFVLRRIIRSIGAGGKRRRPASRPRGRRSAES